MSPSSPSSSIRMLSRFQRVRPLLCSFLCSDWFVLVALLLGSLILYTAVSPHRRFISPSDPAYSHPLVSETVSTHLLAFLCFVLPFLLLLFVHLFLIHKFHLIHYEINQNYLGYLITNKFHQEQNQLSIHNHSPSPLLLSSSSPSSFSSFSSLFSSQKLSFLLFNTRILTFIRSYLLTFLLTFFLTELIKRFIGYPRPNFFARTGGIIMNGEMDFTASSHVSKQLIEDSYQSFISGHTSIAFASAMYIACNLHEFFLLLQMKFSTPQPIQASPVSTPLVANSFLSLSSPLSYSLFWFRHLPNFPFLFSGWIALTRIRDYFHHPIDVVGGAILGSCIAYYCYPKQFPSGYILSSSQNNSHANNQLQNSFDKIPFLCVDRNFLRIFWITNNSEFSRLLRFDSTQEEKLLEHESGPENV
jgi:membrane-associated phospholipid phosphatase